MKFIEQIERYERIVDFIKREATGNFEEFAQRLGISKSTLYEDFKVLKERGACIDYCYYKQSYILRNDFEIKFGYSYLDLAKINGGISNNDIFQKNRKERLYSCKGFELIMMSQIFH